MFTICLRNGKKIVLDDEDVLHYRKNDGSIDYDSLHKFAMIEEAKQAFNDVCVDYFSACQEYGWFDRITRRVGTGNRFVCTTNGGLPPEIYDIWAAPWIKRFGRAPVPSLPDTYEFLDDYRHRDVTRETN